MSMQQLAEELSATFPNLTVRENEPMRDHCSFRIGGPAAVFAEPASEQELAALCRQCALRFVSEEPPKRISITGGNLEEYLGVRKFLPDARCGILEVDQAAGADPAQQLRQGGGLSLLVYVQLTAVIYFLPTDPCLLHLEVFQVSDQYEICAVSFLKHGIFSSAPNR